MSLYRSGLRVFDHDKWQIPRYFIRLLLFWFLVFAVNRIVFVIYNLRKFTDTEFWDVALSFVYALHLDLSAACYLLGISFLFLLFQSFVNIRFVNWVHKGFVAIALLAINLIVAAELPVFTEWGTKLHYDALTHAQHPSELLNSATSKQLIWGFSIWLGQTILLYWFYLRNIHIDIYHKNRSWLVSIVFILLTPGFIFLGIRGGWQEIPINQSDVYFSKYDIVNLAAVNSAWNLGHSVEQNKAYLDSNPYQKYPTKEARNVVDSLYTVESDSTTYILKHDRPNIVMIVLESWSGDVIGALGAEKSSTPFFDSLTKEGLLFTNFRASGFLSDQGMAAIFSGFPAQPTTSIIKQHNKFSKLPSIIQELKKVGYTSSFYFGGDLNYGNIKAYMMFNGFDRILTDSDFPGNAARGKLGVHDGDVLMAQLASLQEQKEPFLSTVFTLSSHTPYDMPMEWTIERGEEHRGYLNSVLYTDQCLKEYFEEAREQDWYANTVFLIVADHGHHSPANRHIFEPGYVRIPLLLVGEPLEKAYRDSTYDKLCSQVDIPATLLNQLKLDASAFKWSKNLFNPTSKEFAYYGFNDGLGWMRPDSFFVYHKGLDKYLFEQRPGFSDHPQMLRQGYSYLQVLFDEYLNY